MQFVDSESAINPEKGLRSANCLQNGGFRDLLVAKFKAQSEHPRGFIRYSESQELLFARGVIVTYEAIRKWCVKFGQHYANQLRRRRPLPGDKWHLDEVFLTINGARQHRWPSPTTACRYALGCSLGTPRSATVFIRADVIGRACRAAVSFNVVRYFRERSACIDGGACLLQVEVFCRGVDEFRVLVSEVVVNY